MDWMKQIIQNDSLYLINKRVRAQEGQNSRNATHSTNGKATKKKKNEWRDDYEKQITQ